MSIIIRLQNLPLCAKSGDIRHFFGGLRIPEGGVHIIGGEKGDAFIAFTSDEDARIAMRKDGGKIKDARIKLFLSSHMEMQYEIERITKCPFVGIQPQKSSTYERRSPEHAARQRSSERTDKERYSSRHSRSPDQHRRTGKNRNRSRSPFTRRFRSRSPRRQTSYDTSRSYSRHGRRSPSTKRRSRSPHVKRSSPPKSRSGSPYSGRIASHQKWKAASPTSRASENYVRSVHSTEVDNELKVYIHKQDGWIPKEHVIPKHDYSNESQNFNRGNFDLHCTENFSKSQYREGPSFSEDGPQALLEKRITEVLTNSSFMNTQFHSGGSLPIDNHMVANRTVQNIEAIEQRPEQSNNLTLNLQSSMILPEQYMLNNNRQSSVMTPNLNQNINNISGHSELYDNVLSTSINFRMPERFPDLLMPPPFPDMMNQDIRIQGTATKHLTTVSDYYVTISGLHPNWSFREVQTILKGIYAPQSNIKWEIDEKGYKTGTAFVKLCNIEDFKAILEKVAFIFNGRRITVSECPDFVFRSYFFPDDQLNKNTNLPKNSDLCYMLKGLPFSTMYEDVIHFFQGLELADIFIIYGENGKATGTGFVTFTSEKDFHSAMMRNGKKIAHRYIELIPSTVAEMKESRELLGNNVALASPTLSSSNLGVPSHSTNASVNRRPLCALLTGLPPTVTFTKICKFFSESGLKPDAVHITLNNKKPNGRAFVEFSNFLDFDAALKCHRNCIGENMICVKQILFDEMSKILSSQKAKHYYTSVSNVNQSDFPEKVPYLWEPPNDCEYENKSLENMWSKGDFVKDDPSRKFSAVDTEAKKMHKTYETMDRHTSEKMNAREYEDNLQKSQYKKETMLGEPSDFHSCKENLTCGNTSENWPSTSSFDTFSKTIDQASHIMLLKHESKGKQSFAKSVQENKKMISKDSCDKEPLKYDIVSKDDKKGIAEKKKNFLPKRTSEHKSSPDRISKTNTEKKNIQTNTLKSKKYSTSPIRKRFRREERLSTNYEQNCTQETEFKHGYEWASSFQTNAIYNERKIYSSDTACDEYSMDGKECVVQISNVHPDIGSDELEIFFHGFYIHKENFVRRYSECGTPTGDVRVTFRNYQEAERAIKSLNRQYLKGIPVEMFIVN